MKKNQIFLAISLLCIQIIVPKACAMEQQNRLHQPTTTQNYYQLAPQYIGPQPYNYHYQTPSPCLHHNNMQTQSYYQQPAYYPTHPNITTTTSIAPMQSYHLPMHYPPYNPLQNYSHYQSTQQSTTTTTSVAPRSLYQQSVYHPAHNSLQNYTYYQPIQTAPIPPNIRAEALQLSTPQDYNCHQPTQQNITTTTSVTPKSLYQKPVYHSVHNSPQNYNHYQPTQQSTTEHHYQRTTHYPKNTVEKNKSKKRLFSLHAETDKSAKENESVSPSKTKKRKIIKTTTATQTIGTCLQKTPNYINPVLNQLMTKEELLNKIKSYGNSNDELEKLYNDLNQKNLKNIFKNKDGEILSKILNKFSSNEEKLYKLLTEKIYDLMTGLINARKVKTLRTILRSCPNNKFFDFIMKKNKQDLTLMEKAYKRCLSGGMKKILQISEEKITPQEQIKMIPYLESILENITPCMNLEPNRDRKHIKEAIKRLKGKSNQSKPKAQTAPTPPNTCTEDLQSNIPQSLLEKNLKKIQEINNLLKNK